MHLCHMMRVFLDTAPPPTRFSLETIHGGVRDGGRTPAGWGATMRP
jgi:hypothetical protein